MRTCTKPIIAPVFIILHKPGARLVFLIHNVHQLAKNVHPPQDPPDKALSSDSIRQIAGSFTSNNIVFHYMSMLYSLHTRETTILKVNVKAGLPKSFDLLIISRIKIVRNYRYVTIIHDPVVRTTVIPFIVEKIAYHHVEFLS